MWYRQHVTTEPCLPNLPRVADSLASPPAARVDFLGVLEPEKYVKTLSVTNVPLLQNQMDFPLMVRHHVDATTV